MLTLTNSMAFSALMGLRSLVPVLLSFTLVRSEDPGAANLMLALQTSAIYGSIIFLIFFNTLSIEYSRVKSLWLDLSIRGLSMLFALLGLNAIFYGFDLYVALIINTILSSLLFIKARVLLEWRAQLIHSSSVILCVIYFSLHIPAGEGLIKNWLFFYFITSFFLLFGPLSVEFDRRNWPDKIKSLLVRIPKIAVVSVLFMVVMLVERYVIDALILNPSEKKNFLFFVSIVNVVALVGSGFLSILGPRIARSRVPFLDSIFLYKKLFLFFGFAQLFIGVIIIYSLFTFFDFSADLSTYLLKVVLLVTMFYYQLLNQSYQFRDLHVFPVVNSVILAIFGLMAWQLATINNDVFLFYLTLSLVPLLIIFLNLVLRKNYASNKDVFH